MLQDLDSFPQIELGLHDCGTVDLDAVERQLLLLFSQEPSLGGGLREEDVGDDGTADCQAAFDGEEVPVMFD